MVKAIDFVVRNSAGGVVRGSVAGDGGNFVQLGTGEEISLNLARQSVAGFQQRGSDLVVTLIDGREIVLSGYFNRDGEPNQLYLSQNGEVIAVEFSDAGNGHLIASYGPADGWDKFSTLDDLRFGNGDDLALAQATVSEDPAGMAAFVPGLLGLGAGGAALAGLGVIGAVVGGGGSSSHTRAEPTVDEPDSSHTVTTNSDDKTLEVSGTGEPGDKVTVIIGGETQETVIGGDGTWQVEFGEDDLPPDGTYETEAVFEQPDGTETRLDGPTFILDLTPPDVAITEGAKSTGDVENAAEYADGVTIGGTGEAGAAIKVEVTVDGKTQTQTTTVGADGSWSVTYGTGQIPAGEHEFPVKVTATDALGNAHVITDTLVVDTVPHPIGFDEVTDGNIVNGAENAGGFVITGTSTAGATLTVTLTDAGGNAIGGSRTVTVGADGKWSLNYAAGSLPAGEYDATVTATTTDAAGNSSTHSHGFRVDTSTSVAFAPTKIAADDVVNAVEAGAGVTMTGTTQPGNTVSVEWGGTTRQASVAADGSWSVTFGSSDITRGSYPSTATVTATDAAGNTDTDTRAIRVDTEISLAKTGDSTGSDHVLNHAESQSGLTVTGTAEPGATLTLTFGSATLTQVVGADGTWTATIPRAQLPAVDAVTGKADATLTVSVKDAAGNTDTHSETISLDTRVSPLTQTGSIAGDGVINAAEAAAGVAIGGTVEAGAQSVTVTLSNGKVIEATVSGGSWTAQLSAADLSEGNLTYTVQAVDAAGNVAIIGDSGGLGFSVDTVAPDAPHIINDIGSGNQLNGIQVSQPEGELTFYSITGGGVATEIDATVTHVGGTMGSFATFDTPVPDGSYLIVRDLDAAGNEASTLYIRNTGGTTINVDMEALSDFDFSAIDLSSAPGKLTLDADDLARLAGPDQTLMVKGGADDQVGLADASATGEIRHIDGQDYAVYSLGDGLVLVDEDIRTSIL